MCSLEAITGKAEYAPAMRGTRSYTQHYVPLLIMPLTAGRQYSPGYTRKAYD